MAAKSKTSGFPWITRLQAAQLVSLGPKQFDDVFKTRLNNSARAGAGAKLRYDAAAVVAALVAYRLEQAVEAAGGDPDLMGAGDSPTKEELLKVKLERERIKLHIDQKSVVPLPDMRAGLAELHAGLRRGTEAILNRWGPEAADVLNREIDVVVEKWQQMAAADNAGLVDDDEAGEPGTADVAGEPDSPPVSSARGLSSPSRRSGSTTVRGRASASVARRSRGLASSSSRSTHVAGGGSPCWEGPRAARP